MTDLGRAIKGFADACNNAPPISSAEELETKYPNLMPRLVDALVAFTGEIRELSSAMETVDKNQTS